MTENSTWSCCLTGKIKSCMGQRKCRSPMPQITVSPRRPTRTSSQGHGREASSGVLPHPSATLLKLSSITKMMLFQRNAKVCIQCHPTNLETHLSQLHYRGHGNANARMQATSEINSTSPTTSITKLPKMVENIVFGRLLDNCLWTMHTLRRNCSYPSCVPLELSRSAIIQFFLVQNATLQGRSPFISSPCFTISLERRDQIHKGPYGEEEKGQNGSQHSQGWQRWRGSAQTR